VPSTLLEATAGEIGMAAAAIRGAQAARASRKRVTLRLSAQLRAVLSLTSRIWTV
jgi:hypothetical protein